MLHEWSACLIEERLFFQLFALEGAVYLWVGGEDARLDSLAVGVPAPQSGRAGAMPSGTTLLGGAEGEAGSQMLAQRLSRKLGRPVFISLNLRDDPQLRFFAEKEALRALTAHFAGSAPEGAAPPAAPAAAPAAPRAVAAAAGASASAKAAGASAGGDGPGRGARTREVFEVTDALAERAAEMLLEAAAAAIARSGVFVVALSGGSIPSLLAPKLLAAGARAQLDRWRFFLADER